MYAVIIEVDLLFIIMNPLTNKMINIAERTTELCESDALTYTTYIVLQELYVFISECPRKQLQWRIETLMRAGIMKSAFVRSLFGTTSKDRRVVSIAIIRNASSRRRVQLKAKVHEYYKGLFEQELWIHLAKKIAGEFNGSHELEAKEPKDESSATCNFMAPLVQQRKVSARLAA